MALIRPRARRFALALLFALLAAATPAPRAQGQRACNVRVTLLQVNDVYRFTPSQRGTPIFKMTADAREMGRIDLNIDPQIRRLDRPAANRAEPCKAAAAGG